MSVVLIGFAVPFVRTVAGQLGEMLPDIGGYMWSDPARAAAHRVLQDKPIFAVRLACQRLAVNTGDHPDLERCRQADPNNGLYAYLEALAALRQPDSDDADLLDRVRSLRTAPRAKLYLTRQYRIAQEVFGKANLPPRRAARAAEELRHRALYLRGAVLKEMHGPILRELTNRLLDVGTTWRESGLVDDAIAAHASIVRLMTDLTEDSPTPDVVLLAAKLLPKALRELAHDADMSASSQPVETTDDPAVTNEVAFQEQEERVASLCARWHELADRDGINVLPYTGGSFHVLLAPREHQNVMCSICVALLFMAIWLVLLVLSFVCLGVVFLTFGPTQSELVWRHRSRSKILVSVIVCSPAVLLSVFIWLGWMDFTWLISLPSLWAVCLLPVLVPVTVGLAARFQITTICPVAQPLWSRVGAWITATALVLTVVLGTVFFVIQKDSWQPPGSIQSFRAVALCVGIESVVVIGIWIAVALVRLIRGRFSLRTWSRVYLHVASVALLAVSVVALAILAANHRLDSTHQLAFTRAAADPVGDRLGDTWYQTYFTGARALTDRMETRLHL